MRSFLTVIIWRADGKCGDICGVIVIPLVQDPGLCTALTPFLPLTLGYVLGEFCIQLPVQGQVCLGMGRSSWAGAGLIESIQAHSLPGGFSPSLVLNVG